MITFMYMSKNVEFWSNAMLHSTDKFTTTAMVTKRVKISMSCQQILTMVVTHRPQQINNCMNAHQLTTTGIVQPVLQGLKPCKAISSLVSLRFQNFCWQLLAVGFVGENLGFRFGIGFLKKSL